MAELFLALAKGDNLIHTLSLVKIGIKKNLALVHTLCKFFSLENSSLRNIDLSRNYMTEDATLKIL